MRTIHQYDVRCIKGNYVEIFKHIGGEDPDLVLETLAQLRQEEQVWLDVRLDGEQIFFTGEHRFRPRPSVRAQWSQPAPTHTYATA